MRITKHPSFTDKEKEWVYLEFKGRCFDCNKILKGYWHKVETLKLRIKQTFTIEDAEIHHIIPVSEWGKHKKENWVLLCFNCHKTRHGKTNE